MDSIGTFDRLVAELSLGERRDMLNKIGTQESISLAPLFHPEELPEQVELERRYREIPWYYRLFLLVLSVFKGKSPLKVFEDRLIARLGATIETHAPGLYDHRRSLLLTGFYDEFRSLKESARFFYDALDGSVVRDKGSFFAFLGSLEMEFIHRRLSTEADPSVYASMNSQSSEGDIRQATARALESILQSIDEEQRRLMYRNVRSLLCLKELASFLFDRILSSFSVDASDGAFPVGGTSTCSAYLVQDQLSTLNDVLFSLDYPPSLPLLESLFVFDLQDRIGTDGFDIIVETRALLHRAEEALSRIRQFNQRVPLTAIIRCATRDLTYMPHTITGGEDWFSVYRDFWRKRLDEQFSAFVKNRHREQLSESLTAFLKDKAQPPLAYAASPSNPDAIPIGTTFALSFLAGFHKIIFTDEINKALKPVLIDGEFYKRENRAEFTESYNELLKLGDVIHAFDLKLSPNGDIGKRYDLARADMVALPVKRRKIQALVREAESEATSICERAGQALRSMSSILGGIINGDAGGRYDSLSNMASLSGRGNTFISSLRNALQKIEKALQLLREIDAVESGR